MRCGSRCFECPNFPCPLIAKPCPTDARMVLVHTENTLRALLEAGEAGVPMMERVGWLARILDV